jgi:hypothetical protein
MLQNAAIDVAIGLILMYLMLSLLCTVANEFIATKLKLRSSTLKDALQKLIDDPTLLNNFYEHGLIASSSRASATGSQTTMAAIANGPAGRALASVKSLVGAPTPADGAVKQEHPSYLAGGTVALALMSSLLKRDGTGTMSFAEVKSAIDKLPDSTLKDALQANVLQANQDIDALRLGIATWFDDAMDRLSGAYKRKLKWIAMLIGLLVAIAFNADSFKVAKTLWNDAGRRESTIAEAKKIAEKPLPPVDQPADREKLENEFKNAEGTLHSLPIGWNCETKTAGGSTDYWTCVKQGIPNLAIVQVLGWLLTAAALSLGAPFWFDLLNKFINLRGAGEKPKREDTKTA